MWPVLAQSRACLADLGAPPPTSENPGYAPDSRNLHFEYQDWGTFWFCFIIIMKIVVLIYFLLTLFACVENWHWFPSTAFDPPVGPEIFPELLPSAPPDGLNKAAHPSYHSEKKTPDTISSQYITYFPRKLMDWVKPYRTLPVNLLLKTNASDVLERLP